MQVAIFLVVFIVVGTALSVGLHSTLHGFSVNQAAMAFFLVINVLICFWEICLSTHIVAINAEYKALMEKYSKTPVKAVTKLLFKDLTLTQILTLRTWTSIWATYALYDPSYANRESFGFFVDFGNGWVTLGPSLLFLYCMTFHNLVSARIMGMIGLVKFYQECYGTVMYAISYVFNGRYKGRDPTECILVVGVSNGLWFFFPIAGMALCVHMILDDSYSLFKP